MALSALQQCYAIVTTAFGAGGSMYTNGHRGADYDADADGWILAYDDMTITSIDHGSGLGWSVGLRRNTIGGFCGFAHIKNLQGAVGTTIRKGGRIAQVTGWGDDHGSLWTGPHIHTTAGDVSGFNCSVGIRPLSDPVPQINAALFAALPKPPSSSPADGGGTNPIPAAPATSPEEDEVDDLIYILGVDAKGNRVDQATRYLFSRRTGKIVRGIPSTEWNFLEAIGSTAAGAPTHVVTVSENWLRKAQAL